MRIVEPFDAGASRNPPSLAGKGTAMERMTELAMMERARREMENQAFGRPREKGASFASCFSYVLQRPEHAELARQLKNEEVAKGTRALGT